MRVISAAEVQAALDFETLVGRLRDVFRRDVQAPLRQQYDIPISGEPDQSLLLMPAWQAGRYVGVKIVTVTPGNGPRGLPAVMGAYLLIDGRNGSPSALIDGPMLTLRRTAAASALASAYLSRPDSARLLMVGTGALAPHLVAAHAAVRPIRDVLIWGRTPAKAQRLAKSIKLKPVRIEATEDLEGAVRGADIVSCATLSSEPLVQGAWLSDGQHLDLVGAFRPDMRETDAEVFRRARIFVDTREGALAEGGDLVQAIQAGALEPEDVAADLFELTRGERAGRRFYDQITLFKSTGSALEDLAAAQLTVERV
ncbi:ornithine cyclodeaminase family protein [Algihabitans albus]|uniref:ornithine cyclodeaminase family protein n=1 Tax=Algihabitans albus TaxID=2164067 RepID=UPI0035D0D6CC